MSDVITLECCICAEPVSSMWFSNDDIVTCEECW
jgi:hypothetical protein